jgi:D-glycerate 3-kinase
MKTSLIHSGKSYLTSLLPDHLSTHHALRLVIMSLDDYYLTHADQIKLRDAKPTNPLLSGRGPAGTHDLSLLSQSLNQLADNNSENAKPVQLATYDKSKYAGEGDRAEDTVTVTGPIDVVIFEGWMNGFASLPAEQLRSRYDKAAEDSTVRNYPLQVLEEINRNLKAYEEQCWRHIDCFVQIEPVELSYVWTWREQVGRHTHNH